MRENPVASKGRHEMRPTWARTKSTVCRTAPSPEGRRWNLSGSTAKYRPQLRQAVKKEATAVVDTSKLALSGMALEVDDT